MKKLSRRALIFLVVGILVVFGASLGTLYTQDTEAQSQLSQELDAVQMRLKKLSPEEFSFQRRELEWRVAQIEVQVDSAKERLRRSVDNIEATETLLQVAANNGVGVVSISSPGLSSESLGAGTYSVLLLTVVVQGSVPNLVNFVAEVGRQFSTSMVDSAEITVPAVMGGGSSPPTATVDLRVYSYQGD